MTRYSIANFECMPSATPNMIAGYQNQINDRLAPGTELPWWPNPITQEEYDNKRAEYIAKARKAIKRNLAAVAELPGFYRKTEAANFEPRICRNY